MVSHEITLYMARAKRFDITYACINTSPTEIPVEAGAEIAKLREAGVRFLDPIIIEPQPIGSTSIGSRLSSLLHNRPDRLLTGTDCTAQLVEALSGKLPDLTLSVWAETASNVVSGLPSGYRFTYAGNPDHKVLDARIELAESLGDVSLLEKLRNLLRKQVVKAAHLKVMRRFDLMWNVAANDAADYRLAGVNAHYLQNMWPNPITVDWASERDAQEQTAPLKIIGNVGNLSATGNSFGLLALGTEIVPELKRRLGEGSFEIHLFGGGRPHPGVFPYLNDPHIKLHGFVDDLDAEILSSPIFLVANNSRRFKVGHTRFLHAWSLGSAVVGFADSAEAMPEIVHGHNAMLGKSSAELVAHVADLAIDPQRRRILGQNGAATVSRLFAPDRVTKQMLADIELLIGAGERAAAEAGRSLHAAHDV